MSGLLWDDEEGPRRFEDDYELATRPVHFNPVAEDACPSRTVAPSTAAGTWPTSTPDDAANIDIEDRT